jgi:hypothetical protein
VQEVVSDSPDSFLYVGAYWKRSRQQLTF